ncbi:MAG: ABC transporter ATP-binding protein, partial [Geminicoccaceae bacterium]|nr:ABC transporter ATP-binding protein [Geminicoccaceae bacterium]
IDLPDRGQVCIDGQNLAALDERERTLFRRHKIGFVFQFFNLLPTLTVAENVRLPLELNALDEPERVDALLDRVGLLERRDSYPDKLSGGEQQRVAVARALVHRPALVLADEPTGNLDSETGAEILQLLAEMAVESNQTMVMATHSREASQTTDRIYSMRKGRLE